MTIVDISPYVYRDKSLDDLIIWEWVLCPHSYGNGFYVHILTGMGNGFISDTFSERSERPEGGRGMELIYYLIPFILLNINCVV